MPENRTRYAILGALTLKPMSGYGVRQMFEQGVSFFWRESYGQIYPILKQLADDGLVEPMPGEESDGRSRVYRITPDGRAHLARWLGEPAEHQVGRVEVLLKLFFAREAPSGATAEVIREFRAHHAELLRHYDATEAALTANYGNLPELPLWLTSLSYGRHVSRALVEWCAEAEAMLAAVEGRAEPG